VYHITQYLNIFVVHALKGSELGLATSSFEDGIGVKYLLKTG
jgi:hypothetical protein